MPAPIFLGLKKPRASMAIYFTYKMSFQTETPCFQYMKTITCMLLNIGKKLANTKPGHSEKSGYSENQEMRFHVM